MHLGEASLNVRAGFLGNNEHDVTALVRPFQLNGHRFRASECQNFSVSDWDYEWRRGMKLFAPVEVAGWLD